MKIDERHVGDVVILDLIGKITLGEGVELLMDTINGLLGQGHRSFILNMADVPYIDSAGNGEIVRSYTSVSRQGGTLKFLSLTKRILDLWSITKLLVVFETYESESDAVKSFHSVTLEVSCPLCRPPMWIGYSNSRFLLSCTLCDTRFSPSMFRDTPALLKGDDPRDQSRATTLPVKDLWWFTYYENGYGPEGVHLTFGRPTTVVITGRLDLFSLDIVQTAWDALPRPRRVLFDTTHVRLASPAGIKRLNELCNSVDGRSRGVVLSAAADRDRAMSVLGSLEGIPQSIDVSIRRVQLSG
jgi:anti-sigma B factor antagonist